MNDIELLVTRAITKARLAETILHGRGQWEMSLGAGGKSDQDLVVPAVRVWTDKVVGLVAHFPAHSWLDQTQTVLLTLCYEGEEVAINEVRHPGDGNFVATWEISIGSVEAVG